MLRVRRCGDQAHGVSMTKPKAPAMQQASATTWYDDPSETSSDSTGAASLAKYNVSSAPNDFNVSTIHSYLEAGVITIPPFQRNYVWDRKRASRLIESLLMGLPIPQVFLYERASNNLQVIDGQQRLLTIYFYLKGWFPVAKARGSLREKLKGKALVPEALFSDEQLFEKFTLNLPLESEEESHPLEGKSYADLSDQDRAQLGLRTLRVVICRQNAPTGDESIYEIFNRLNSGGVNLTPQEVRHSLYFSDFMERLRNVNADERWRNLLGQKEPDPHYKDVEFLLRAIALLVDGPSYRPSMTRFLNSFSHAAEKFSQERVDYFENLLIAFFDSCEDLPADAFYGQMKKFTVSIFDSVFAAWCASAYKRGSTHLRKLSAQRINKLKSDHTFVQVAQARTTGATNVRDRIKIAARILSKPS